MAFSTSAISPAVVDTCGGNVVTVTGSFVQNGAYLVATSVGDADVVSMQNEYRRHARVLSTSDGLPVAYSGVPGNGNYCVSLDGTTLQFVSPKAPPGDLRVRITEVSSGQASDFDGFLQVMPPFISSFTFTLRSTLPLNYRTGPRSIAALPAPDGSTLVDI